MIMVNVRFNFVTITKAFDDSILRIGQMEIFFINEVG